MTKELIENIRTIIVPYMAHDLRRINYENMGEIDAEQFKEDMNEILDLAAKALEQQPYEKFESTKEHIYKLAGDYKCWDNRLTEDEVVELCHILEQQPCEDCISRQAAIDALDEIEAEVADGYGYQYAKWREYFVEMPSAQAEQRWIPCSERLPEESGRYLVSVLDGVGRRTTVAPYQPRYKAWTMTGRMAYWKVIAWMPLPEPYKEEQE